MDIEQYNELTKEEDENPVFVLKPTDLKDRTPRTLLWGYDCDRNSWHVYLDEDEKIHLYVYTYEREELVHKTHDQIKENDEYVPNKRLYPEACDYEFCYLLKLRGVYLPFTTFNADRKPIQFYGELQRDDDYTYVIRWLGAPMAAVLAGMNSTAELREAIPSKPHPERFSYARDILRSFAHQGEVHDWARAWFAGTQEDGRSPLLTIVEGMDRDSRLRLKAAANRHIFE